MHIPVADVNRPGHLPTDTGRCSSRLECPQRASTAAIHALPRSRRPAPGKATALSASDSAPRQSTRERLLEAALDATDGDTFSNLSLRSIARRVGIVPTGFYRHFPDMDTLGLTLVDEAFGTLHDMIRSVREDPIPPDDMIRGSVAVLVEHVDERPSHFRFIAQELNGGAPVVRQAIREHLDAFTDELAADLAELPIIGDWDETDRTMFADLIVKLMVAAAAELIEFADRRDEIAHRTEQQLRLAVLAVPQWRS